MACHGPAASPPWSLPFVRAPLLANAKSTETQWQWCRLESECPGVVRVGQWMSRGQLPLDGIPLSANIENNTERCSRGCCNVVSARACAFASQGTEPQWMLACRKCIEGIEHGGVEGELSCYEDVKGFGATPPGPGSVMPLGVRPQRIQCPAREQLLFAALV